MKRWLSLTSKRNEPMKIDGACHCGYIRVEGEADPEKTTVCHCTDCQVGTGSAFRVNAAVAWPLPARAQQPAAPTEFLQIRLDVCGSAQARPACGGSKAMAGPVFCHRKLNERGFDGPTGQRSRAVQPL